MSQPTLFDVPEAKQVPDNGLTCRDCDHRERWQCGSIVIQYCGVRKSNRTDNGLLKIRCKDKACTLFKPLL